jgi:hypothetical protein
MHRKVPGTFLCISGLIFSFLALEYMMVVWYVIKYKKTGKVWGGISYG